MKKALNGLRWHGTNRGEAGSSMVTALWVTAVLTIMGMITGVTAMNEHRSVGSVHRGKLGLYAGESGLIEMETKLAGKWYSELVSMGEVTTARSSLDWTNDGSWQALPQSEGRYQAYVNSNEGLAVIEVLPEGSQVSRGRTAQTPYDESWGATKIIVRSVGVGKSTYTNVKVYLDALALSLKKLL